MTTTQTTMSYDNLKFKCTYHDTQDGARQWTITNRDGAYVGWIEKSCVWVGGGYGPDAYTVNIDPGDSDEDYEECFEVRNIWNGSGPRYTAREAFMKAKTFAREVYNWLVKSDRGFGCSAGNHLLLSSAEDPDGIVHRACDRCEFVER